MDRRLRLWEFNRSAFSVTDGLPQFQRQVNEVVDEESLRDTFHTQLESFLSSNESID